MEKITHVGVLVRDLDAAIEQWCKLLDLQLVKRLDVLQEGVYSAFLSCDGDVHGFFVELVTPMHPDDPDNVVARRLREHGEGLLILAMIEPDIARARARLDAAGVRYAANAPVTDSGDARLIVSPKSTNGVLLEILSTREWSNIWRD